MALLCGERDTEIYSSSTEIRSLVQMRDDGGLRLKGEYLNLNCINIDFPLFPCSQVHGCLASPHFPGFLIVEVGQVIQFSSVGSENTCVYLLGWGLQTVGVRSLGSFFSFPQVSFEHADEDNVLGDDEETNWKELGSWKTTKSRVACQAAMLTPDCNVRNKPWIMIGSL